MGKNIYLSHLIAKVQLIDSAPSAEEKEFLIEKFGGVSVAAAVAGAFLFMLAMVVAGFLAISLIGADTAVPAVSASH